LNYQEFFSKAVLFPTENTKTKKSSNQLSAQKSAGHSKIETTRMYYLAVEESDVERARKVQKKNPENQTD